MTIQKENEKEKLEQEKKMNEAKNEKVPIFSRPTTRKSKYNHCHN